MSQRTKRLIKKAKEVTILGADKVQIKNFIEKAEKDIEEAKGLLNQISEREEYFKNYVEKNKDTKMFMTEHKLVDGTPLEVCVVQEGRTVIVSALGLTAVAKAHEHDNFIFEIGYQLALNRLITQYLEVLMNAASHREE